MRTPVRVVHARSVRPEHRVEIGRGRSGVVYREPCADGPDLACKVFDSRSLTRAVQVLLLGAPNPYMWNEDAVRCAVLRRELLAELVEAWFGPRLSVARADGMRWNADVRAYELRTEFVSGRPPRLYHPLRREVDDEARELRDHIMAPLQARLEQAGFDGMLWQAGHGNPVALNNFLLEEPAIGEREEPAARERQDLPVGERTNAPARRWAWIDLESGVPALAPLDPRALFRFYLPRSRHHGRPLFDDVDVARLRAYLDEEADWLTERLGRERLLRLRWCADLLERHQRAWKKVGRVEGSIEARLARGEIDAQQAQWYRQHRFTWLARELSRTVADAAAATARASRRLAERVRGLELRRLVQDGVAALVSQRRRAGLARVTVRRAIDSWRQRSQLSAAEAAALRTRLESQEVAVYLSDFGMHLAVKPVVKIAQYWAGPALFAAGWIGPATLAVVLVGAGPLVRTLYTAGRILQLPARVDRPRSVSDLRDGSASRARERPWVALAVGALPVVGNLAYPAQLLASSTQRGDEIGRFMLCDALTRIGRSVPVWGGADTALEHGMNRVARRLTVGRR